MYYKVPLIDGVLDADYNYLESMIIIESAFAYAKLRDGHTVRPSWQIISEDEIQAALMLLDSPETTEQKLARIEEQNLILMDALATTFDEVLELRAIVEGGAV